MNLTGMKKLTFAGVELKQLAINGVQVWKSGYTNLVPSAIDTDGSIYNGVGYVEGYRLSSSGSLSAQANTVTTGFIKCKATDVIRMGGVGWDTKGIYGFAYLAFFDAAFALLGSTSIDSATPRNHYYRGIVTNSTDIVEADGVTTFYPAFSDGSKVAYFRVNGFGDGADMIVTVNEEIT